MTRLVALIRLRLLLAGRQFRGRAKWTDRAVAGILGALGIVVSLMMAAGFCITLLMTSSSGDLEMLRSSWQALLWSSAFFGLFLPLLRGGTESGLEPDRLLIYPLSRWRLFAYSFASSFASGSHLFYYPSLVAAAVTVLIPLTSASFTALLILVLFVTIVVAWSHLLAQVVRVLMTRRRLRELFILGGLLMLIISMALPALLGRYRETARGADRMAEIGGKLEPLTRVASVLPPSFAVRGLCPPGESVGEETGLAIFWLSLWAAVGLGGGYGLFLRERGGTAPVKRASVSPMVEGRGVVARASVLFRFLPPEVRAVALKDLRYLMRSVLGRFSLLMAPVLVVIFVMVFSDMLQRPMFGIDADRTLLFSTLLYLALLSNNFFNNAFAWEGGGTQHYFLCPVTLRRVLLGKNLALWVYNGLVFLVSMITWFVVAAPLPPGTVITGFFVFFTALFLLALGGNLVSVWFPVARNPAAFMASPSHVGVLTGLLSLVVSVLLCGMTLLASTLLGLSAWQPLIMGFLLVIIALLHHQLLGVAARVWANRTEPFLQATKKLV